MGQLGIQLGWIPYLNLLPMHKELMRLTGSDFPVLAGHPTSVNRWLCDGTVALAPCSSINLLKARQVDIALPLGVASEGAVQSVYLGLHREHADTLEIIQERQVEVKSWFDEAKQKFGHDQRQIAQYVKNRSVQIKGAPSISFTPNSAASKALVRIFLSLWFGVDNADRAMISGDTKVNCGEGASGFIGGQRPIELVIGDDALARRCEFAAVLDLGQLWWDVTGLPFVFAVWQSSLQTVPQGFKSLLLEAASISSVRMKVDPSVYFPDVLPLDSLGHSLNLPAYWQAIQYKLSGKHLQGLLLYLTLYSSLFECVESKYIPARLARWGGQWSSLT